MGDFLLIDFYVNKRGRTCYDKETKNNIIKSDNAVAKLQQNVVFHMRREREREEEFYYTTIEILGSSLFLQSALNRLRKKYP